MFNRLLPWRTRPTSNIIYLVEEASMRLLYLVQENSPTSFVLMDDFNIRYKISIGKIIKCTCSPDKKDHCIHTIYALLKIFQIPHDNQLIWQSSYLDEELNYIVFNRNKQIAKMKLTGNNNINYRINSLYDEFGTTKKNIKSYSASQNKRNPIHNVGRPLNIDDLCLICHECMNESEGITYCKINCGNNFHIKCCVKWTEYKVRHRDISMCPICKCNWGEHAYGRLIKEQEEFDSRSYLHKGHYCQACKTTQKNLNSLNALANMFNTMTKLKSIDIKGRLFHCIYCKSYELCEKCYLNYEHYHHNKFLVKENINWIVAKSRERLNSRKNKNFDFCNNTELSDEFEKNPKFSLPTASNLNICITKENETENNEELCIDRNKTLETFIGSCFLAYNIQQDEVAPLTCNTKKFIGNFGTESKSLCIICKKFNENPSLMKRLFCKHLVDEECLIKYLKTRNYYCPEDNCEILKGFKSSIALDNDNSFNTSDANIGIISLGNQNVISNNLERATLRKKDTKYIQAHVDENFALSTSELVKIQAKLEMSMNFIPTSDLAPLPTRGKSSKLINDKSYSIEHKNLSSIPVKLNRDESNLKKRNNHHDFDQIDHINSRKISPLLKNGFLVKKKIILRPKVELVVNGNNGKSEQQLFETSINETSYPAKGKNIFQINKKKQSSIERNCTNINTYDVKIPSTIKRDKKDILLIGKNSFPSLKNTLIKKS